MMKPSHTHRGGKQYSLYEPRIFLFFFVLENKPVSIKQKGSRTTSIFDSPQASPSLKTFWKRVYVIPIQDKTGRVLFLFPFSRDEPFITSSSRVLISER
jgi:hypothetical protein